MLEKLYPGERADSAYAIDYEGLCERGMRGVIFDIDNTLVPHGAPADGAAIALFSRLRGLGCKSLLLSNNKEGRVRPFADAVGALFLCKAGKPKPAGYVEAMRLMGTDQGSTIFVGDQIFTDVYGANLAGIPSILVRPIDPKEEIQIVLKRIPERAVLYFYERSRRAALG